MSTTLSLGTGIWDQHGTSPKTFSTFQLKKWEDDFFVGDEMKKKREKKISDSNFGENFGNLFRKKNLTEKRGKTIF